MDILKIDKEKLTPIMQQYYDIKLANFECIIFFRLGDFYEMFFEDALEAVKILEITLTGKKGGLDEKIPMCGVPYHAAENYIEKLVENNFKVAICEQLEDASASKGLVNRGVVRIVSSGTLVTELKQEHNNFIGGISKSYDKYYISYIDISTGEFYTTHIASEVSKLVNKLLKLDIKEIIHTNLEKELEFLNNLNIPITKYENYNSLVENDKLDNFTLKNATNLLNYLKSTQNNNLEQIKEIVETLESSYLEFDLRTVYNLELTESYKARQKQGSLYNFLNQTKTAMGSRMLKNWILNPLTDLEKINSRLDKIEKFSNNFILRHEVIEILQECYDLERINTKIIMNSVNARDLLLLKKSLQKLPNLIYLLQELNIEVNFENFENLYNLLENSIHESPSVSLKEGNLIKAGYNEELDSYVDALQNQKTFLIEYEEELKNLTNIKTLKVAYNRVFGYFVEVSKAASLQIVNFDIFERKQTLANAERYVTEVLKEKEVIIIKALESSKELEYTIFNEIKEILKTFSKEIQKLSYELAVIDCLANLSNISDEYSYVRPVFNTENKVEIKEGRHPLVEINNVKYVKNDVVFLENDCIKLVTGPNMAGKSTYMRQLGIIVIMAQMGCLVPADYANLPIFDKIFTRIGSNDDLLSGESTFMVEMKEANNALQNATKNSLIIFDELGVGTSTYDGMSLAEAIIEYINKNIHAKTLFATHYHELTAMSEKYDTIKNVHVAVSDVDEKITFLHKVKDGAADKSYGIHVAVLANIPNEVIENAKYFLNTYENRIFKDRKTPEYIVVESKIEEEIKNIDISLLTPLEAINILNTLKNKIIK